MKSSHLDWVNETFHEPCTSRSLYCCLYMSKRTLLLIYIKINYLKIEHIITRGIIMICKLKIKYHRNYRKLKINYYKLL